ncbi:uncharacterized protein DUF4244 [Mumia flava]|uniref:Uncharacterized protein DUF4244 n=1 Tax=Mumia flava TaxID=1348852 RepID=A0A0B2BJV6_9ACTN|nr:DUF4244 domain-containing protein [Mumia flava]PJJ57366.1 uncharacterized protein DUF4244 [Mumia flava]
MTHHPNPTRDERGTTTAEYGVGTVGAIGIAITLYYLATRGAAGEILSSLWGRAMDGLRSALPFLPEVPWPW